MGFKVGEFGSFNCKSQTCALIKSFDLFCWGGNNGSQNFIFNFSFYYHFSCSYVDISLDSLVGCLLFILYIYQLLAYFSFLFFPLHSVNVIQVDPQYQWFPSSVNLVAAKHILIHWWQFVLCFVFVCFANPLYFFIHYFISEVNLFHCDYVFLYGIQVTKMLSRNNFPESIFCCSSV